MRMRLSQHKFNLAILPAVVQHIGHLLNSGGKVPVNESEVLIITKDL
jgi:hypothetical protein